MSRFGSRLMGLHRSQFCAAEHIDGLVYGHPMFGGSSSSPPQILEDQFDDSDGMYLTVDGDADTQAALDFHGDADLVQEYEAPAPSYSTKVFLECGK